MDQDNISICTSLKNRCVVDTKNGTRYLFKNFILSIKNCVPFIDRNIELIISDFVSDDIDDLYLYINSILENTKIDIKIITINQKFNRGLGCNKAIEEASNKNVLVLDVDMKFDHNLLNNFILHTCEKNNSYFPICYSFEQDPSEKKGFWLECGYGNGGFLKEDWLDVGKIPEYKKWGDEDVHFFNKLSTKLTEDNRKMIREQCPNFFHQWHPSDITWKSRYY